MRWHLLRYDNTILRSVEADSIGYARFALAPIEEGCVVVSALSHACGESREVIKARARDAGGLCKVCNKWIGKQAHDSAPGFHRYCYARHLKRQQTEAQRQMEIERRARYKAKLAAEKKSARSTDESGNATSSSVDTGASDIKSA